ncbi:hypothetical protein BTN50_0832 [Candidatus Enterovibrio altilux]|uniref:Uncharacterized protein n=1 Tax=Candidatus Enterovibrio altilux TaxID=1927128 RepID=A0A291B8L3_9GAMM|nr:hypothetical protein BTN50_0832 [Candidatus Enterovibrio luxaltus]
MALSRAEQLYSTLTLDRLTLLVNTALKNYKYIFTMRSAYFLAKKHLIEHFI